MLAFLQKLYSSFCYGKTWGLSIYYCLIVPHLIEGEKLNTLAGIPTLYLVPAKGGRGFILGLQCIDLLYFY